MTTSTPAAVTAVLTQIKKCDKCRTYAQLCQTFDASVVPELEKLLKIPLRKPVRDHISPDECCPEVRVLRETLSDAAWDAGDVWFFLYRAASNLIERQLRKRGRGAASTTSSSTVSPVSNLIVSCFVLFCNKSIPDLSRMVLRWSFLKSEKAQFESSDAYVNSNASERRKLHMSSVLSVLSERAHRHYFSGVWMQCIEHASDAALHVHLLHRLGSVVLPHLTNPVVVADYLSGCFASGGLVSVLAMQGLFVLMLDHGLEYPRYYEQLYSLITPDAFSSRHRYELFRLLELSMTSLRMPSYVAASVVKKIAQVALASPAPALYFVLPFIRKVLQNHPNCLALIHRTSREAVIPDEASGDDAAALAAKHTARKQTALLFDGKDPFDGKADLKDASALSSTLWELTALERHFLPVVPLMVSAFGSAADDKTPLQYEKTYARLFTAEVTRPLNKDHLPTIAYREPEEGTIFSSLLTL